MSTQFLGLMLIGVYSFFLCISAGFWYYGTELQNAGVIPSNNNGLIDRSLDFNRLNTTYSTDVKNYTNSNAFNPSLIFGDFGAGVTNFVKLISEKATAAGTLLSGGIVVQMLQKLGFPSSFQLIVQVIILGFGAAGALIYYISGRQ